MTQYIKGLKIRTDQTTGKRPADDHDHRHGRPADDRPQSRCQGSRRHRHGQPVGVARRRLASRTSPRRSRRPTETRQVAGQTCTVHDLKIAVPMQMGNIEDDDGDERPAVPGQERAGPGRLPRLLQSRLRERRILRCAQAKTRPAAAKAMTDMYKKMAELGVPFATRDEDRHRGRGADGRHDEEDGQHDHDRSHVGLDVAHRAIGVRRAGGLQGQQAVAHAAARHAVHDVRCRADSCGTRAAATHRNVLEGPRRSPPIAGRSARSDRSATTISSGPGVTRPARRSASAGQDSEPRRSIDDVEARVPAERDRQRVEELGIASRDHDQSSSPSYPSHIGGWPTGHQSGAGVGLRRSVAPHRSSRQDRPCFTSTKSNRRCSSARFLNTEVPDTYAIVLTEPDGRGPDALRERLERRAPAVARPRAAAAGDRAGPGRSVRTSPSGASRPSPLSQLNRTLPHSALVG